MSTATGTIPSSQFFGINGFKGSAVRWFGVDFQHCDINVSGLEDILSLTENEAMQKIELNFLNDLRGNIAEDTFLPKVIIIRKCMKFIFNLANNDTRNPRAGKRALIGSPGVGKSILFFLVALIKARKTPVVYYRKTKNTSDYSLFFMNATKNEMIRIVFTRKLLPKTDSMTILNFLDEQRINVDNYYTFVDGPNHTEKVDIYNGYFDYFCTSGGYPLPKQEEFNFTKVWILDAWTKDEAIAALSCSSIFTLTQSTPTNVVSTSLTTVDDINPATVDVVEKAYWLCGGSIRNILEACKNSEKFEATKQKLENIVKHLRSEVITLALTTLVRADAGSDSIRSMFRENNDANDIMHAVQIVDSQFILGRLSESLDSGQLFETMTLAESMVEKAVQGVYFERCCHRCFKELIASKDVLLQSVVQGNIKEELTDNTYWLPSTRNFPDIDAAVVHKNVLYALQYTVGQKHSFEFERFCNNVACAIYDKGIIYSSICIVFVVPLSTNFTMPTGVPEHVNILDKSDTSLPRTRSTSQPPSVIPISTISWQVNTKRVDLMKCSLSALFTTTNT